MPSSPVRIRDALAGGLTAALLFEILKKALWLLRYGLPDLRDYIRSTRSFPIFMVRMYVSWLAVLLGAELTAAMPERRMGERDGHAMKYENEKPTLPFNAALSILHALDIASKSGRGMTLRSISQSAAMSPASAKAMLQSLKSAHFVNHSRRDTWFLKQSLSDTTLHELQMRLGLTPDPPIAHENATAWQGPILKLITIF